MSTAISPRFMQELRDRLTLSEVIGRKIKLTRAGREYKACCPFHGEKSPSFTINDDKQFYHCFGCGAHGDAVGFVMQHDNLSFIEAVEVLAAQAGLQVPKASVQDIEASKREKSLYALMDDTTRFFEQQLRERGHKDALAYLRERGLDDEVIAAFRLGFSPADGQALVKFLLAKGYSEAQMLDVGVARKSDRNGELYSFFRDRVMFPVADRRGRVVAFGGRVLPEHIRPLPAGAPKPPKYINSSETTLFHKGRMVYGESHARQAAAEGQPVIVVEGYLDVIACFQAGWRGAVAPLGTALTDEQIAALWKMIPAESKMPVLCFDGDAAGQRAAVRAAHNLMPLLKPHHSAVFAFLPTGQDPDSLIKAQGAGALKTVLEAAIPLVDFIWTTHTAGKFFNTPEMRAGLEKILEDETARIADRSVQQYYRQMFREKIASTFSFSGNRSNKLSNNQKHNKNNLAIPLPRPQMSSGLTALRVLLATAINHPEILPDIEEEMGLVDASAFEDLDRLRQELLKKVALGLTGDSQSLVKELQETGWGSVLQQILSDSVYVHAGFARPGAAYSVAIRGWRDTYESLSKTKLNQRVL